MEPWVWIAIAAAAAAVVLIAAGAIVRSRARRRTARLRARFGPEYDRALAEHGRRRRAEAELESRLERRAGLEIRPLDEARRGWYREAWEGVAARFVDAPAASLGQANGLVIDLLRERGYPTEDFEQRAADISVDHPHLVEHYRSAREIAIACERGEATTEDLRHGLVHFRSVLDELLQDEPAASASTARA